MKYIFTALFIGTVACAAAVEFKTASRGAALKALGDSAYAEGSAEVPAPVIPHPSKISPADPAAPGQAASGTGQDTAAASDGLPTEDEIAAVVQAQNFEPDNIGIAINYVSPSGQKVMYRYNPDAWWYPASTTKLVVLAYVYYYAYTHRNEGEDFNREMIEPDKPYIARMIRSSDNEATAHLADKYGRGNIKRFPKDVLGYEGIETGWELLAGPDRVTARGMNRLICYIYDDKDTKILPLPVKKEIRAWLELSKIGQLAIQNAPVGHFLDNPDLPDPYDPQSGLSVGMKAGWTDDVGSGVVSCFNWQPQGSRWTATVYHTGNWAYFSKIGNLYRDLFLLFKDKR